jgi:uncharacterized protein (TIGR01440 family)
MNETCIREEILRAVMSLGEEGHLKRGGLFILGCSTSEIVGKTIGRGSVESLGEVVVSSLMEALEPWGMTLGVGCCEHLNRAIVLPRAYGEAKGYRAVSVRPVADAGGACGAAYFCRLKDPMMAETVEADAGMDIGHTLIGMHLKRVAVPFRPPIERVGKAPVVMAFTRPPLVGGSRARY